MKMHCTDSAAHNDFSFYATHASYLTILQLSLHLMTSVMPLFH